MILREKRFVLLGPDLKVEVPEDLGKVQVATRLALMAEELYRDAEEAATKAGSENESLLLSVTASSVRFAIDSVSKAFPDMVQQLKADAPQVDRRKCPKRAVVSSEKLNDGGFKDELECGHTVTIEAKKAWFGPAKTRGCPTCAEQQDKVQEQPQAMSA